MLLAYTTRNLIARKGLVLPTLLAVAAAVGATTVMLAMLEGLVGAIRETGRTDNALVMSRGANDTRDSAILLPALQKLKLVPGIVTDGSEPLLSAEYETELQLRRADGHLQGVPLRGVDASAYRVHAEVQLQSGAAPQRGQPGVLVGRKRLGELEGLNPGGTVRVGRSRWPVVGVFAAPGTWFESELWADRTALVTELRRDPTVSTVTARLSGAGAQDAFAEAVGKIPDQRLKAWSEHAFYQRALAELELYLKVIAIVVLVLTLGAVVAAANAMYSTFLGRKRELATLLAMGYGRGRVILLLLVENLLIAGTGGLLGLALALAIDGRAMQYQELQLVYAARVTPRVLAAGIGLMAAIGVLSGVGSVIAALQLRVLQALREP